MKASNQTSGLIDQLFSRVETLHETSGDPSHDFAHVRRVLALAMRLAQGTQADVEVLSSAILLHDIVPIPKGDPRRSQAAEIGARAAAELLRELKVPDSRIQWICRVIAEHSFSAGHPPSCIESEIMQDADRLDALGAIGVMRLVTTGGRLGSKYLHPDDPFLEDGRSPEDRRYMVDHFFTKLFKLESLMNTEAGRREARARSAWMRGFLEQLRQEIGPPPTKG